MELSEKFKGNDKQCGKCFNWSKNIESKQKPTIVALGVCDLTSQLTNQYCYCINNKWVKLNGVYE